MKPIFMILLALSAAACREKAEISKPPSVRKSGLVSHIAAAPGVPEPLLKTPRIMVIGKGSAVYAKIQNAAQAEAVLADIRALPVSAARDSAIANVIGSLAEVDSARAVALLESWDDCVISTWLEAAQKTLMQLAKSDPESAARFIEKSAPSAARTGMWASFLANLPPEAQPSFFERIPESSEKLTIAANLLLVWVAIDPAASAAWLDGFAVGLTKEELKIIGNPRRFGANPNREAEPRLAAFRAAKTPEARSVFAEDAWKKASPSERASLIFELRDAIPELVASEWETIASEDPAAYATHLTPEQIASFSPDDMRKLIEHWAEKHPEAAIDWALKQGRPEAACALGNLYRLEPKKALELAVTHKFPPGKDLDQAISFLCQSVAHRDAEFARTLLPLIADPEMREGIRKEVDRNWD